MSNAFLLAYGGLLLLGGRAGDVLGRRRVFAWGTALFTAALSRRWMLLVNVPIGVLVVALTPRVLAESPREGGRFDLAGALTSALGLALLALGLARVGNPPLALGAGALLLVAFVLVERRAARPVTPLRLFADRARASALPALLLIPMTTMSAQFLIVQYLQEALGWGALLAGLAFLPMALGMLVTARYAPRLMGTLSARSVALLGTVALTGGLAWLCFLPQTGGYALGVAGPLLLIGAGLGFVVVPFNMTIMSTVAPADSGAAAGLLQTAMLTGASLGIAVLSGVYASSVDGRPSPPSTIAHGMSGAFTVATGIAAVALVIVAAAFRTPRPPVPDAPREAAFSETTSR
ncbi:MFS transporter [Actinomadura logoneensis]|uniref:MFS transporter n=1 Tax=Actinomadura logoneensis TaxID=2293572 RepID=UPI001F432F58|nr:MFS transporter [Actinomadura logoneensis]